MADPQTVAQSTEMVINWVDLISLVSSIASLILAVGAIWLSIVFYRLSSQASQATTEAAKGIDASVQRLEKLFDKLYSDTFSMMRDTVTDMRKHIWSKPEADKSEISPEMKREIQAQVMSALDDKSVQGGENKEEIARKLEVAFEGILEKARSKKRLIKAEKILSAIKELGPIKIEKLADALDVTVEDVVIPHIFNLRKEGKITWSGSENGVSSDSVVEVVKEGEDPS
ncbi:MAG: hypothetical protein RKO25_02155 [Candidatus Contendobacter sp.]|nr:hypothetical protein [Candidatus Contendobacter sp.]